MAGSPAGSISGAVDAPDSGRGVLIVAEGNADAYSTLADLDGNYQLVNVADGSYEGYYQFRVTSIKTTGGNGSCEISQTEDLKGVFYVQGQ